MFYMNNLKVIAAVCAGMLAGVLGAAAQFRTEFPPAQSLWDKEDTVEVMIIGDVMMHARQLQYDHTTFLEGIRGRLLNASVSVANMEFTLAGEPYTGYPCFSAPDSYAEYVRDCGVDVFLMANNHILDKGLPGVERTLDVYEGMEGIYHTGVFRDEDAQERLYPLILAVDGIRIAFVNFTYGTNNPSREEWPKVSRMRRDDIQDAVRRARWKGADFIVALPHWGEEYVLGHNREQEKMAQWLAESGVDAIVGAHPHVVQDSTVIRTSDGRKVPVFYSVGNAVSNMSATNTRLEMAVTLRFAHRPWSVPQMLEPRVELLWCTLPGTLTDSYMTIPVREYEGRPELWKQRPDYDNMMRTLERVLSATGIKD